MIEFEWEMPRRKAISQSTGSASRRYDWYSMTPFLLSILIYGGEPLEERYVRIGTANGILLTVVYTERDQRIRIISARKATTHEEKEYYRSQTAE